MMSANSTTSFHGDEITAELKCWLEIQDALVDEINITAGQHAADERAAARQAIETQAALDHANIVLAAANEFHSLVCNLVTSTSVVKHSNEAVLELLAWKDILDNQPLPHVPSTVQEKEANYAKAVSQPDTERLELERKRLEDTKREAERELASTASQLTDMKRERAALSQQIESLAVERTGFEQAIHALRVEKLDDRSKLESELTSLRQQIHSEKEVLKSLKAANDAASVSSPTPLQHSTSASYGNGSPLAQQDRSLSGVLPRQDSYASTNERSSPVNNNGGNLASSPVRGDSVYSSASAQHTPSLNSGLRALQNVREQLRDIRETHSSPQRANSFTAAGSVPRAAAGDDFTRSNTFSSPSRLSNGGSGGGGGAAVNRSAASEDAASPWKQRLSKLQGDLRLLKAELGTNI